MRSVHALGILVACFAMAILPAQAQAPAGGQTQGGQAAGTPAGGASAAGPSQAGTDSSGAAAPAGQGQSGSAGQGSAAQAGAGQPNAATAAATEGEQSLDAGTYAVRLRDLEQRINELKEQIFRSKARLSLLAETVLQGVVAGSQAIIIHENKMSASYQLVKVVYALDGAPIFNRADEEGGLAERDEFQVYNGSIVPGEHTLTVNLEYRGHGYGIFSYLKGYRFKVRSNYSFTAPEGRAITVRVVGYEKGGPTAPLEERPAIRYIERVTARGGAADESKGKEAK